ncbi:MAG TPA: GDSL-type esterase/lipase family protein [Burkholderiaceae bacterium]|nr:GDSL-type esterase/lipase family protein [Burkholderiaceae bacterium]
MNSNLIRFFRALLVVLLLSSSLHTNASGSIAQTAYLSTPEIQAIGRVAIDDSGWHATWPGVAIRTRFEGRAIGIIVNDARSGYTVEIDGKTVKFIASSDGEHTVWLRGLHAGPHQVQLIRRNESPEQAGTIRGFLLDGGHWLPALPRHERQIEFIGDSFTAGLANLSTQHSCNAATVRATTDAGQAFGVQVARHYHADWELNAMSGMGMNRNWNGNRAEVNFGSFYPRLLQNDASSKAEEPEWHPQLLVIGLGINDFSTPLHDGENWTRESLAEQFKTAYKSLIDDLRARYGAVAIIATAARVRPDDQQAPLVQQVVNVARANGDLQISYLEYDKLQLESCQWHPTLDDHRRMAQALIDAIDAIGIFAE